MKIMSQTRTLNWSTTLVRLHMMVENGDTQMTIFDIDDADSVIWDVYDDDV